MTGHHEPDPTENEGLTGGLIGRPKRMRSGRVMRGRVSQPKAALSGSTLKPAALPDAHFHRRYFKTM